MRINKTTVENVKVGNKTVIHWDDTLSGFGLRVTATGAKAYIVQGRVNGRSRRVTLGRANRITATQARKLAQVRLADLAAGVDPAAERKARRAAQARDAATAVTLNQVFAEYKNSRRKDGLERKPLTLRDIQKHLNNAFADWVDVPIINITRDGVLARHSLLSKRGPTQADQAMRYLRALINFARDTHTGPDGAPLLPANPVDVLRQHRRWHKPKRKRHVIPAKRLGATVAELEAIAEDDSHLAETQAGADMLLLILFTGLRIGEASTLRWEDVDDGIIRVRDPKNRRQDTALPLSDEATRVLERRFPDTDFVFPGRGSHLKDTRRVRDMVADDAGGSFTNHDLRRTFATIAESLGVGGYTLKRLLNHAVAGSDVTGGYIVPEFQQLQTAANAVGSYIRSQVNAAEHDNVVPLRGAA